MSLFVGRAEPLSRLAAAYQAVSCVPGGADPAWAGLVLVTGEAGMGKTALLTRFASEVGTRGATVVWGTCWDGDQTPAWWPWTQALRELLEQRDELRDAVPAEVRAAVLPELGAVPPRPSGDADDAGRLLLFDAVGRLLAKAAGRAPVVVVLDDLQWSDPSTLDLLRFLGRRPGPGRLLLVGSYRPNESGPDVAAALAGLAGGAELVLLQRLSSGEVAELVRVTSGAAEADRWAGEVHERSGGHPLFARELCRLLADGGPADEVPVAVRELILSRLARVSADARGLLDVAAVAGAELLSDVLADVSGHDPARVHELVAEASTAGIVSARADQQGAARFVHDLYRETTYAALPPLRRLDLHRQVAEALVRRHQRGSPVFAAELAHHFASAVPVAGAGPALRWARAAADGDVSRVAFAEAAGHLNRVRSAVARAGQALAAAELVEVLTAEAELWLRSGDAVTARNLLDEAWRRAEATGQPELLGAVALGLDRCGARFAMPRAELIAVLDAALRALAGSGTTTEAQVTAALARQLQHSIPGERPRARSLAERAVAIARGLDDPGTLASCLLAHHDTLWTPGTGSERVAVAGEIAELARAAADSERLAQALLLSATARLENGSPAFRATLGEYEYVTERLRQPRHDYLLRTRLAALALLDGDIGTGERLSAEAAALGESVGDSDTGNVRMSQRLEIVRARADEAELRAMAAEAVRWWVGAPAHAHAVAAGFSARAGDLEAARRELDTVLALDDWRTDRSYLWSVFVGEVAVAAIAVQDAPLCRGLLDDLLPLAGSCAVNGALVCFMGSHAHRVGLLHAALGDADSARQALTDAREVHRRLGARLWEEETCSALVALGDPETRSARSPGRIPDPGGRHVAGQLPRAHGVPARRQGPARPGRAAGPPRGGRAGAGAGGRSGCTRRPRERPGSRPDRPRGLPAPTRRPRRRADRGPEPVRSRATAAGERRTRAAAGRAAPRHQTGRHVPPAWPHRRRAGSQGGDRSHPRRHPPRQRRPARAGRAPRPLGAHGCVVPVRARVVRALTSMSFHREGSRSGMETTPGYVDVNGLHLYYEEQGVGSPLVLLHGGMMSIDLNFAGLIPDLATRHRVIGVEMQGHGRTGDIDRPITLAAMADDVVGLLDHLGIDRAHVLGHSLGAGVATELAISHPDRVRSIVPVSLSVRPEGMHEDMTDPAKMATSTRMPTPQDFADMQETYQRLSPHPDHFDEFLAGLSQLASQLPGWSDEQLGAITAPTLLVLGDRDFTTIEHGGLMLELIPGSQLVVLPGTTHMEATRRPDLLLPMLAAFLD